MDTFSWPHVLSEAGVVLVPVLIGGYIGFRQIRWQLKEFGLHRHGEKVGPLHAENIMHSKTTNGN